MRFPAQVEHVRVVGICDAARVVNESHSGIAILVADAAPFVDGATVDIDYNGAPMPAVVRRIQPRDGGDWLVGLEWQ